MQAGSIGSAQPLRDLAGMLVTRPDEAMLALGAVGERQVAGLRALLAALLLSMPLASALSGAPLRRVLLLFAAALLLNTAAQALLAFSRRSRRHPWLPFASSSWDVTATTLVLVALGLGDWPAALNNVVAFCGYLLAIVLTALRNDGRVTLATGVLAIAQYGLLSMAALSLAGSPEELLSADHGAVQTGGQALRLAVLAVFTIATATLVLQMRRLVELSATDGLTGLPNRNWLVHQAPRWLDGVARGDSATLALVDLDGFRRVNEEAGQPGGDRALREVAALFAAQLGPGEHLVRLGGEEFVLLLRKPMGTAWEHVEALRRTLAGRGFIAERGGERLPLTFSSGLASCPRDGGNLSGLLRRADQRLQQAKASGRNRVVARDH